ncbi:MAG: PcfJ domain-containing protein [Lachnospiraceae bacterium]|nr:PcfJ domain-containing protein [Lachnospiraceae bacterium]
MQPRTKEEKRVMELSAKLPPLSPSQRAWALSHIGTPTAYVNKRNAWCSECGEPLPMRKSSLLVDVIEDKTICPHCGKELTIQKNTTGSIHRNSCYYTIVTTCKGYQVFRHFLVVRNAIRTCEITYAINEAVQIWVNSNGKETIVARDVNSTSYYIDSWLFNHDMSIKHKCDSYYAHTRYEIRPSFIYPNRKYIPTLKRNGFKGDFMDLTPSEVAKNILSNNDYEFLIKTKQISLFKYLCKKGSTSIPYKYAVNICNRNNYIIKDASLWFDMMDALAYLDKDLRSPHYICPSNLKAAHDKYIEQKIKMENQKREEQEREDALKWEKKYKEMKERFFDLNFSNDHLSIKVLRTVAEFEQEGTAMHHCVFARGYYKEEDSLILSARKHNGERIETIEVNLDTFEIIQSRGVCNSKTEFHDEILQLMKDNMYKIKMITASLKAVA